MDTYNPCISCGACCAFFRASFYWAESDLATPGGVPHAETDYLQTHLLVMKGTDGRNPRCVALEGVIGHRVRCAIYDRRPSVCRSFMPSWQNGSVNERCDRARAKWGLAHVLHSHALEADSVQTRICWQLSAILLTGLVLNAAFGWWWADGVAALGMAGLIAREGWEAWRERDCC